MAAEPDLTSLLQRWRDGDAKAFEALLAATYDQLERRARAQMRRERDDHTLDTGALVHEAYLRLVDLNRVDWRDRAHFLAMASRVMRQVLVDYAKRKRADKRGGGVADLPFDDERMMSDAQAGLMLELDDLLRRLEAEHPRPARAVELHYIGGLTQREIAESLEVSQPTVTRDLKFGQAWLSRAWSSDGVLDAPGGTSD